MSSTTLLTGVAGKHFMSDRSVCDKYGRDIAYTYAERSKLNDIASKVPTKVSDIENDSNYISGTYRDVYSVYIGGHTYPAVKIGKKLWLAENLDYKFDGCNINTGNEMSPSAWYYNTNEDDYGIDGKYKCGLMYNMRAVTALKELGLPTGWRIPTVEDVNDLNFRIRDADDVKSADFSVNADFPSGWNGINTTGMSIIPSGQRNSMQMYREFNEAVYFWTSDIYDEENETAYCYGLYPYDEQIGIMTNRYVYAFYLRLVMTLNNDGSIPDGYDVDVEQKYDGPLNIQLDAVNDVITQSSPDGDNISVSLSKYNNMFIAEYNVTPYADILKAYNEGKVIRVKFPDLAGIEYIDYVNISYNSDYDMIMLIPYGIKYLDNNFVPDILTTVSLIDGDTSWVAVETASPFDIVSKDKTNGIDIDIEHHRLAMTITNPGLNTCSLDSSMLLPGIDSIVIHINDSPAYGYCPTSCVVQLKFSATASIIFWVLSSSTNLEYNIIGTKPQNINSGDIVNITYLNGTVEYKVATNT